MRSPDAMDRNSVLKKRPTDSTGWIIMLMYCVNMMSTPRPICLLDDLAAAEPQDAHRGDAGEAHVERLERHLVVDGVELVLGGWRG